MYIFDEKPDDHQHEENIMPRTSFWPEGKVEDGPRNHADINLEKRISMFVFPNKCLIGSEHQLRI